MKLKVKMSGKKEGFNIFPQIKFSTQVEIFFLGGDMVFAPKIL